MTSTNKLTVLILFSIFAFIFETSCHPLTSKPTATVTTPPLETNSNINIVLINKRDVDDKYKAKREFDTRNQNKDGYDTDDLNGEKQDQDNKSSGQLKSNSNSGYENPDKNTNYNNGHNNDIENGNNYNNYNNNDNNSNNNNNNNNNNGNNDNDGNIDKNHHNSNNNNGNKDDSSKPVESTATNTVVKTVIVVATESPTVIYSDSKSNPSKQKGDTSADSQESDPNSTSSSVATETPSNESSRGAQARSNYHKLVLALSIVGSIAGIAIFAGIFVVTRFNLRKRKQKAEKINDEESGDNSNNNSANYSISPSQQTTPPPEARISPLLGNNDTTPTYPENPFLSPVTTPDASPVLPSAPPPAALSYPEYRVNRTLSMVSQTTTSVVPSAPTAKELDAMNYDYPLEEEYGTQNRHQYASLASNHRTRIDSASNMQLPQTSASILPQNVSNFPPPPAYTPRAIPAIVPSAPPLYVLPTQVNEQVSSRRHSISSCSNVQILRPPSVRRGSGTISHL